MTTFEQARALYGSDEQMARALFEQIAIVRGDLELQQALRRRAEEELKQRRNPIRKPNDNGTVK
jgi:5'-3' exonuclease